MPPSVNLVDLLRLFPTLLEQCLQHASSVVENLKSTQKDIQILRLINKEASLVSMMGLTDYTITLMGKGHDTHPVVFKLLQYSRLQKLGVHFHSKQQISLGALHNPEESLQSFISDMGSGLHLITSLELHFGGTLGKKISTGQLAGVVSSLLVACPALTSLAYKGQLPPDFLKLMGEKCPLVSVLSILGGEKALPYMQKTVPILHSSFPQMSSLCLPTMFDKIPDMSKTTGILQLILVGSGIYSKQQWLHLPPSLQHLECGHIRAGPPSRNDQGHPLLGSLRSVKLDGVSIDSSALAELLHAAPLLHASLHAGTAICGVTSMSVFLNHLDPFLADNLLFVHDRLGPLWLRNVKLVVQTLEFSRFSNFDLPRVTGITECSCGKMNASKLGPLLSSFPDLETLALESCRDLDDIYLQEIGLCVKLKRLKFVGKTNVTSVGLSSLCERLPALQQIECTTSANLMPSELAMCAQMLLQKGMVMDMRALTHCYW